MVSADRIHTWQNAPLDSMIEYVERTANRGRKAITTDAPDAPGQFQAYAQALISGVLGLEVDHWVFWCSILDPVEDPEQEWMPKFPHSHGYDGLTLIQYLQAPEEGGELALCDQEKNVISMYEPKAGQGAILKDHEVHGVRAVRGSKARITLIAGAYPFPSGPGRCRCGWDPALKVVS